MVLGSDSRSSALIVAELSYSSSFLGTTAATGVLDDVSMGSGLVLTLGVGTSVLISSLGLISLTEAGLLLLVLFASELFLLGTGELLAEGVALFCNAADSSQDDVEDPDSSSEDKVGGWSPD